MTLPWTYRAHSEIGLVRKNNQDSSFVGRHLLLVADGMGGAAAGDLASAVAVDSIKEIDEEFEAETTDRSTTRTQSLLSQSILHANSRIADLVSADFTLEGMGTTVTAALLDHDQLTLAHIGDSRAYLWREGRLEQLTHDHSWVQSLIDDGKISEAEAAVHPHRSLLLKVLNGHPANEPDVTTLDLLAGDRLLFCSDGLCGFVADDVLAEHLALPDLDAVMAAMIEAAHEAGGPDNITIILVEFGLAEVGPAEPATAAGPEAVAAPPAATPRVLEILGAAAERDIPSVETMIRNRQAEDDLDEADPDDPLGNSADDEDRYAPQPPTKRRIIRPLIGVLIVVLALAAGVGAGYAWSRTQYFVGNEAGQVAIFSGVSGTPRALGLAQVYEVQQLPVSSLPPLYQGMVNSAIDVADLAAARATVRQLWEATKICHGGQTSATTTPRSTSSVSPSGTPRPGSTATSPLASASARSTSPPASGTPSATSTGVLPPAGGQSC